MYDLTIENVGACGFPGSLRSGVGTDGGGAGGAVRGAAARTRWSSSESNLRV